MEVIKGFKYRIYPNKEQEKFLASQFGAVRFVYNHFLANRKEEYLLNKKSLNYYDDAKSLTDLKTKDGYAWLNDINSQSLQYSLRNLEAAYNKFFRKLSKFPKFHSRKSKQCFKIPQHFVIKKDKLYIPKLKAGIKISVHRDLPSKQLCCYISRTPTNKYYVSFLCEVCVEPLTKLKNAEVGIDLGIKSLLITSDGEVIENQNFYRKSEKKLIFQQRKLSKKKKGSNNRRKQRKIVAKVHEKVHNSRLDYIHKITYRLINENQVIIAESLAVKNMIKNHCLAKSIQDVAWGELLRQLEYKASWYGRIFHQIDRFFPSSKTCNNCRFLLESLSLDIREWVCPNCGKLNDRDVNAALNIRDKGLKDLKESMSGLGTKSDVKQKHAEALGKKTKPLKHEAPALRQG